MLNSSRQSPSHDSHAAGTRFWLYLGAVLLGFALMAIEDKAAVERPVDQPASATSTRTEEAGAARPAGGTSKPTDIGSGLRSVSAEIGRHGVSVSAK